jgi:hypothetical protein
MRTRTTILIATVIAALLAGVVSPAAAESGQAAANAAGARMLEAPRAGALVTRVPVRVVVRAPARTSRLRVRVGGRDVTARFRRAGGSVRVANLTRGDGLRDGNNHLSVLAERRGGRPVIDARSFVLARRHAELVRLRVRPGPVTSINVWMAGAPSLAPEHFGRPGAVERRLSVIRRERTVRVWLNGRPITRVLDKSRPTRWTASLSASHGLRHGVNRLRMLVVEPDRGRYELLRRRFVVRRNRHLAAAGWDIATRVRGRVRLDGRRSRTIHGARLRHSWRILSRPRGSDARLRRVGTARPLLTPDRRGRYVVALTVTDRTGRATAAQAMGSSTDTVEVAASPASLLVPFKGYTEVGYTEPNGVRDTRPGIQVGDTFYPNPSPAGPGNYFMQWLTLDRETLTPIDPVTGTPSKTGNGWVDGTADRDHGVGALKTALASQDVDQLVILSFPRFGVGGRPPVQQGQIDDFNDAMKTLGVGPIDKGILQASNKLAIVGVPSGGGSSGRYTHGGRVSDGLTGWLMPDAVKDGYAFRFRFQPERPAFDTSSSSTPATNTMTVRDQHVDAALPAGATGGFQVAIIDPIDFAVVNQAVFATNGVADPATGLSAMAKFLNDNAGLRYHIAVQSIGQVVPPPAPTVPPLEGVLPPQYEPGPSLRAWYDVGSALAAYGANPHIFNTVDGSYAFLGGPELHKSEGADSSSAVVIDPTKKQYESGTLRGRVSMRADGYWTPTVADGSGSFESSLYDMVFRSPTPWPYTAGGAFPPQKNCPAPGNDTAAYAAALSYIALGIHLPADQSDLRAAYVKRDQDTWSDQKTDLGLLQFESRHGFGEAEFCNLKAQLQQEFDWLDRTKELFDSYKQALGSSGNLEQADLQQIGQAIQTAIAVDDTGAEIGWTVGGFVGNLVSAGLTLASTTPEGAAVLAAWEALVAVYELVRELVSETGAGSPAPVGDQVTSKVEDLSADVANHLFDTATGLVRLRDVIISDYGRLQALGSVIEGGGLNIDPSTMTDHIRTAARAFFSSELVPIPYGVYALFWSISPRSPWREDAGVCTDAYGFIWRGAPASTQLRWMGDFDRDGHHGWFPTLFVLGRHTLSRTYYAYPPATVTDPMFTPPTRTVNGQKGYGMQLSRFVWEQYEKGSPPTDIALCDN